MADLQKFTFLPCGRRTAASKSAGDTGGAKSGHDSGNARKRYQSLAACRASLSCACTVDAWRDRPRGERHRAARPAAGSPWSGKPVAGPGHTRFGTPLRGHPDHASHASCDIGALPEATFTVAELSQRVIPSATDLDGDPLRGPSSDGLTFGAASRP
jgi:hypothetical protein